MLMRPTSNQGETRQRGILVMRRRDAQSANLGRTHERAPCTRVHGYMHAHACLCSRVLARIFRE